MAVKTVNFGSWIETCNAGDLDQCRSDGESYLQFSLAFYVILRRGVSPKNPIPVGLSA